MPSHEIDCQCEACTDAAPHDTNEFDLSIFEGLEFYNLDELGVDGLVEVMSNTFGRL